MRARFAVVAAGCVVLGSAVGAQVPVDQMAIGAFSFGAVPGSLVVADPIGGSTSTVGGLGCIEINSVVLDPYDRTKMLIGGINPPPVPPSPPSPCPSPGILTELTLSGLTVVGSVVTPLPAVTASLADLVLDDDGNVFVGAGPAIYKVDRVTGFTTPVALGFLGTCNALAYDPVENQLFVGVLSVGQVLRVDPETGSSTAINSFSVAGITGSATISGLALSEDRTKLYACTFGTGLPGAPGVGPTWIVELPTNPALWPAVPVPMPVTPAIGTPSLNDIEIQGNTMYTLSSGDFDIAFAIDLAAGPPYAAVPVAGYPRGAAGSFGTGAQIALNEFSDKLTVFPRRPTSGAAATFKIAVGGPPGDIVGVGIVGYDVDGPGPIPFTIDPIILGIGPILGADGNFALPPLPAVIDAGTSGAVIRLGFARISGTAIAALNLSAADIQIQ